MREKGQGGWLQGLARAGCAAVRSVVPPQRGCQAVPGPGCGAVQGPPHCKGALRSWRSGRWGAVRGGSALPKRDSPGLQAVQGTAHCPKLLPAGCRGRRLHCLPQLALQALKQGLRQAQGKRMHSRGGGGCSLQGTHCLPSQGLQLQARKVASYKGGGLAAHVTHKRSGSCKVLRCGACTGLLHRLIPG